MLKYDTHGSIVIVPTADDNDMDYTCEANHPAIPIDMPLRATIKLSVFCKYYTYPQNKKIKRLVIYKFQIKKSLDIAILL